MLMLLNDLDIMNPLNKYRRTLDYILNAEIMGWNTNRNTLYNKFTPKVVDDLVMNLYIEYDGNHLILTDLTKHKLKRLG